MGCGSAQEENGSQMVASHHTVAKALDLTGYGVPAAAQHPSSSERAGARMTVLVSINDEPQQPHEVGETELAVRLKVRMFDAANGELPPPCAALLEFSGITIEDTKTFAQQGVCADAMIQLRFEPIRVTVELYGVMMFVVRGTGRPSGAVWSKEPVQGMLIRLIKNYVQDTERIQKLLDQSWFMHIDTGCFSKPVKLNLKGTVEQAGIVDGATLMPESHAEYFEAEQKGKYVCVGMTMRYYGDLVELKGIDESGGLKQYVIFHDNQDKRTILNKLQFVDAE